MTLHERELEVIACVKAWREATCIRAVGEAKCVGENHLMFCPVELALQELIAAHNSLELHRGEGG